MDTDEKKLIRLKKIRQEALGQLKELQQRRHDPLVREEYLNLKMAVDLVNEAISELY